MVVVKRSVTEDMKTKMLEAILNCRKVSIELATQAPIGGPEYKGTDALRKSLDDMTGILTGNRELFWTQIHSTPSGMHINCKD